jgi:hypothetical protein
MVEWPDGSHSSVKGTWQPARDLPKGTWRLSDHEQQDFLVWWNQDWTLWTECQASRLEETWHQPYCELWLWQHHVAGMFFKVRDWDTSQDQGKDERSKLLSDPWWKPAPAHSGSQTGEKFTLQQDNDPKHAVKTIRGWLRDMSLNVLEWTSQSPDLKPIEHL